MNLEQTRQLLSFLWSKFPNGRALSVEDKQMTAIAYFDELWEYSLQDAIAAARKALKEQPHFIPSAPEIAHHAVKSLEAHRYYPQELDDVQRRIERLEAEIDAEKSSYYQAFQAMVKLTSSTPEYLMNDIQLYEKKRLQSEIDSHLEKSNELWRLKTRMKLLIQQAFNLAEEAYDREQIELSRNDFKRIGWIGQRFELENSCNSHQKYITSEII